MTLIDVTDAMGMPLWYDRSTNYGVPHPEKILFRGSEALFHALQHLGEDLGKIGWLDCIDKILTGGVYVNKPGAHREGIAIDFDGAVLKEGDDRILVYRDGLNNSMHRKIAARFACLVARRFGVVLTEGYNAAHRDHIHADLSRPVMWYGSKSQVVLVQEVLHALYGAGLRIDGKIGVKTKLAWSEASGGRFDALNLDCPPAFQWLLDTVSFEPPGV